MEGEKPKEIVFLSSDGIPLPLSDAFIDKSVFLNNIAQHCYTLEPATSLNLPSVQQTAQELKKGSPYDYSKYIKKQFDSMYLGNIDTAGQVNFNYGVFSLFHRIMPNVAGVLGLMQRAALGKQPTQNYIPIFETNQYSNSFQPLQPVNADDLPPEQILQLFALTDFLGVLERCEFIFSCKGAMARTWKDITTKEQETWHPHSKEIIHQATKLIMRHYVSVLRGCEFCRGLDNVPWQYLMQIHPPRCARKPLESIKILTTNMLVAMVTKGKRRSNGYPYSKPQEIDAIDCSDFFSLQYVDLHDLTEKFPNIKFIYLSNNNIDHIFLPQASALGEIDLRNNALTSLPPISLAPGSKLRLAGNPLSRWQKLKIAYRANPSLFKASLYFLRNIKLKCNYITSRTCWKNFFYKEVGCTVGIGCWFTAFFIFKHPPVISLETLLRENTLSTSDTNALTLWCEVLLGSAGFGLLCFTTGSIKAFEFYSDSYQDLKRNLKRIHTGLTASFLPYNPFEK